MRKICLLGASGRLGGVLQQVLRNVDCYYFQGSSRNAVDISNKDSVNQVLSNFDNGDWVINSTGYNKVDNIENSKDKELSYNINVLGVKNIAEICSDKKLNLIQYSSSYVFDGSSKNPYGTNEMAIPQNSYGEHKLLGENLAMGFDGIVIRTDILFGTKGFNLSNLIVNLPESSELYVVDDQFGTPSYAKDLALFTSKLIDKGYENYQHPIHFSNQSFTSRFEFAKLVSKYLNPKARLIGISTDEWVKKFMNDASYAKRPQNAGLTYEEIGINFTPLTINECLMDFANTFHH